jgi:hypothetical protein
MHVYSYPPDRHLHAGKNHLQYGHDKLWHDAKKAQLLFLTRYVDWKGADTLQSFKISYTRGDDPYNPSAFMKASHPRAPGL